MNNDMRWKQRFQNFEKAFNVFQRRMDEYEEHTDAEVYQMALIQGFEMIQELSWKVLKDYLENQGYDDVGNPKKVIRQSFQDGIISKDAEVWMDSIKYRNLTSHIYDESIIEKILDFITDDFYSGVGDLYNLLKKEL